MFNWPNNQNVQISNNQSNISMNNHFSDRSILSISDQNNNKLVSRNFDLNCVKFRESKEMIKKSENFIINTIKSNTTKEVETLNNAIKQLNNKVEMIMKTPQVVKEKEKIEEGEKVLKLTLKHAMEIFEDAKNKILEDTKLTDVQKKLYLEKLQIKLMEKLYSPEEIAQFKKILSNTVIVIPSTPKLQGRFSDSSKLGLLK